MGQARFGASAAVRSVVAHVSSVGGWFMAGEKGVDCLKDQLISAGFQHEPLLVE